MWNDEKAMTVTMRSKEQAHDYRYFPDPDLVPFTIDKKVIDDVRAQLPELPQAKWARFLVSTVFRHTMLICSWQTQGWLISLRPRSRHILKLKR